MLWFLKKKIHRIKFFLGATWILNKSNKKTPAWIGLNASSTFPKGIYHKFWNNKMCQISMGFRQRLFGKCPKVLPFGTKRHLLLVNERPMKSKCDLVSSNKNCAQAFVGDVLQRLFISKIKLQSSIMSSNTLSPYHKTLHCNIFQLYLIFFPSSL